MDAIPLENKVNHKVLISQSSQQGNATLIEPFYQKRSTIFDFSLDENQSSSESPNDSNVCIVV